MTVYVVTTTVISAHAVSPEERECAVAGVAKTLSGAADIVFDIAERIMGRVSKEERDSGADVVASYVISTTSGFAMSAKVVKTEVVE